ncbi:helix-turn-helix transcriptional regulator [Rhodobacteraceae bacterium M382]|nr:helix-turn-helix transcriptional regulator [Rhodobacteraceae bacterium M382]
MTNHTEIQHVATISELHRNLELAKPLHPLVSLIRLDALDFGDYQDLVRFSYGFYTVSLKRGLRNKVHYGHHSYDFDEGVLALVKPHQVMAMQAHPDDNITGWMLVFHPDFLSGYPLSEKIGKYGFFSYEVDEALHLSDREEQLLLTLMQQLHDEYSDRIDTFSQDVMISQLDLLLSHVNRFYNRQFLTRTKSNADVLSQLDAFLDEYFDGGKAYSEGFPAVSRLAKNLSVSPSYLNDMLTSLTGSSARDYIQRSVVQKAKLSLSLTTKSVSEIGYELGFQHSQSFNKFFKKQTNLSPGEYRKSIN